MEYQLCQWVGSVAARRRARWAAWIIAVVTAATPLRPSVAAETGASAPALPPARAEAQPAPMERQREIAMALSACPPEIAGKAAVYVLEASGCVKVRESQNGFTAIVQHSSPTTQEPQCMDAEGTRTLLPRMLKVAELRAQGKSREEIRRFVAEAFANGTFQPPARPGIDYMLSNEILTPNAQGVVEHFPPHVMFYAPYLTNAEIGGQFGTGAAFVAGEKTPHALIIVPVGEAHHDHQ